ncbi:VC2046/SO_2500 family protein [Alteromonas sp. AMM-1]|uniref:VC2046/SO_2500 family protein n=1 Tax=Alteromonas sp. AMM-1 TaxID=3394233 RepID=UPI0039A48833
MQTQAASQNTGQVSGKVPGQGSELAQRAQRESTLNVALHRNADTFKLYLSLFDGSRPAVVSWQQDPAIIDEGFPQRLNHYRRPPIESSTASLNTYLRWQQSVSKAPGSPAIRFWQSMHPDPLSFSNNAKKLPFEVTSNCAYTTQLQLQKSEQSSLVLEAEDSPTMLADTIPASQHLLM